MCLQLPSIQLLDVLNTFGMNREFVDSQINVLKHKNQIKIHLNWK